MLYASEAFQLALGAAVAIETQAETLFIQRQQHGWQLYKITRSHPFCSLSSDLLITHDVTVPSHAEEIQSWNSGEQESTLRLIPCMTDKNLVLSLAQPIVIPAGRRPRFFVSLPLMYQVYIGNAKHPFYEFPIEQLPLNWFGSNTRKGELCYQFHSALLQDEDALPKVPHRAMLELRVCNRDGEHLHIDKLNVPAQYLPVYRVDGQHYWTTSLTITNEKLTDNLSLHYSKTVTCRHHTLQLVSESRLRNEARTIMRALEAIIG